MSEQTAVAAPSAAQESTASIEIPRSGTPEYAAWRVEGTLPEKKSEPTPKPAETASADTSKETLSGSERTENAPGTEPGKSTQEHRRKPQAEARIAELTARTKQLEKELEEARKPKTTQADPSPARQIEPAKPTATDKEPTPDDKNPDGTAKFKSYEEYVKAQARWEVRQEIAASQAEQARNEATRKFADSVSKAREAYADFDTVAEPMAVKVNELILDPKVDGTLKKIFFDSDGVHILYALGSDPTLAESFGNLARTDPAEAIYLWKSLKAAVKKELSGSSQAPSNTVGRDEKGKFTAEPKEPSAPAKRGPENAPEPPIDIGHRGPGVADESERALKAAERGDPNAFAAWKKAEDAKELRRRRGA